MRVIVSNLIEIENPSEKILDYCKNNLIFKNPEYNKKMQMGFYVGKTPKLIHLYDKWENSIYVPIGCLRDIENLMTPSDFLLDYRCEVKASIKSKIILRDYQSPCEQAVFKYRNGLLILPCGMGKTECALACANFLQQKTLFIAHTNDLVNQAKTRCENNLICKTSLIAEGKVDLSGDIVFATVQTLQKKLDEIPQDTFGLVVCDEVHHLSANAQSIGMFRECLDYFASRYKLGLTATLHRADGLEGAIPKLLGEVMYEIEEDGDEYVGIYEGKEVIRFPKDKFQVPVNINFIETEYSILDRWTNNYKDVFDKNGMTLSFSKLITSIANDTTRNKQIIDIANSLSGSTIILSDRVDQLKYLAKHISNSVQIDGSTKKQVREKALKDIDDGKVKVLLASYKLAKEGLDCKILENIILATPIKDYAIVVQCIGRCQRPYKDKKLAQVYDLVDDVSMLNRFLSKRKFIYRKKGWLKK